MGRGFALRGGAWALLLTGLLTGVARAEGEAAAAQEVAEAQATQAAGSPNESAPVVIEPNSPLGPFEALQPRYHSLDEIQRLLQSWGQAGRGNVRSFLIDGRVPVLEFGGGDVTARPLEKRRVVLLVGGLDGRSLAGGEAVLHSAHRMLTQIENLRDDLTIIAVPWAAPETLAMIDQGRVDLGRDLDGDGLVTEMLVEDPRGKWTLCTDDRFLTAARPGDAPRYRREIEGRVAGRQQHALAPDELFAWGASSSLSAPSGQKPQPTLRSASDHPVAAYLEQTVLNRPTACVVVFQGNHGGLATPGATAQALWQELPDERLYARLGQALRALTGREAAVQSQAQARGQDRAGSFVDWCYAVPGVLAFEVAPWGVPAPQGHEESQAPVDPWSPAPPLDERGRAWARWLDEERGGMGFSAWRPVERSTGDTVLVGGWKPKTFHNPPEDALEGALRGLDQFVEGLVQQQARLELCDVTVAREGELCTVSARIKCSGGLPLHPVAFGRWAGIAGDSAAGAEHSAWMQLDVPASLRLLAGPKRVPLGDLDPGAKSANLRWLLMAPAGSRLNVHFGVRDVVLARKEISL